MVLFFDAVFFLDVVFSLRVLLGLECSSLCPMVNLMLRALACMHLNESQLVLCRFVMYVPYEHTVVLSECRADRILGSYLFAMLFYTNFTTLLE